MLLSKSDFMDFLRHPALLWLKKHEPSKIPPIDSAAEQRTSSGNNFEKNAEELFPGAVKVGFNSPAEYQTMIPRTEDAWKGGAKCVVQGMHKFDDFFCITDVLEVNGDGFTLTEIKSSNSVKPQHVTDLAFQKLVLEANGFNIHKCQVLHANADYKRNGDIDYNALTLVSDVTDKVKKILAKTEVDMSKALSVVISKVCPDLDPLHASSNFFSDWLKIREELEPRLPDNSIYKLPKISYRVAGNLIAKNIKTKDSIKDDSLLSHGIAKYWRALTTGEQYIDTIKLKQFLDTIKYPVYYLDYETHSSPVPEWDNYSPHQQVPFQYSLHIKRSPETEIEHHEYLHQEKSCPVDKILLNLKELIRPEGTILVWNESFEKKRNEEMGKYKSNYSKFLDNVNDRVIDLMDPFRDDVIMDPEFLGSNSIKDVSEVMLPGYSYNNLTIKDGGSAASEWVRVTFNEATDKDTTYANLKKYCERDTEVMVKLHEKLIEITKN